MATHAHNVRLTWIVEISNRIEDSEFLAFKSNKDVVRSNRSIRS